MRIFILLLIGMFVCAEIAPAQSLTEERIIEIKEELNDYVKALKSKRKRKIEKAYSILSEDKEAMRYIKDNYPRHHYSLKMYALSKQAKEAAFNIDEPELPDGVSDSTGSLSSPPSTYSNSRRTSLYPNQSQPSNRSIVESTPNQNLPDNRSIVESDPNQKRIDNRELLEIRKRSLPN